MAWVIAIVCIILVVIFWRIFIPLAVVAAVGIVLLVLYIKVDSDRTERKRIQAEQEIQERIAKAKSAAGDIVREWEVSTETDPASGEKVPRSASVLSDGGLCRLQVEQRINAARLAGIYCPGLKVSPYDEIEVKFDNRSTSDKMRIDKFSNGDDVYIPSSQPTFSGLLQYDEFLQRMTGAKRVALLLTVEGAGQHWITFSLAGSGPVLTKIGALASGGGSMSTQKKKTGTQISTQKKPGVAQESAPNTDEAHESELLVTYGQLLSTQIMRYRKYPVMAQRRGWEGTAEVLLQIADDGRVTGITLGKSSGYDILDEGALDMARRASPLPQAPPDLRGRAFVVPVPIVFRLQS